MVESLAIDRAKQLFGAEHANVQPHSGAQANMAVYLAALQPGDTILAWTSPTAAISRTACMNFSGKLYKVVHYGVDKKTDRIDFDQVASSRARAQAEADRRRRQRLSARDRLRQVRRDRQGSRRAVHGRYGPLSPAWWRRACITSPGAVRRLRHPRRTRRCAGRAAGFVLCKRDDGPRRSTRRSSPACKAARSCTSSPPRPSLSAKRLQPEFKNYASQIIANAKTLAEELDLAAAFRSFPAAPTITCCWSTSPPRGLTGKIAEEALDHAGITVNKNMIPFDPRSRSIPPASASARPR